ncbi:MAG: TRAP transporter substrate-binding protein [Gammaproteobacteria bacterium]|nr:TRAP transporter substrate-binding protein [Gammaproteobacteria bacterium]
MRLWTLLLLLLAVPAGGTVNAGTAEHEWRMILAVGRNVPIFGSGATALAESIEQMSGGRIAIKIFSAGELVPPFEIFDAVSRGTAEIGLGAAYFWKGKVPEAQLFSAVPFGMTPQETNSWLYSGDGLALWQKAYEPFGLVPYPAGNTGIQMAGWFNREITTLADLKGLKIRMPGLGGEVMSRAGATTVNIPGGEIFSALQAGTIDGTEWISPFSDMAFGLHRAAKYYYYPGWQEPGSTIEALINRQALEALPEDLQAIIEAACMAATMDMLAELTARNAQALTQLIEAGIEVRPLPADVLQELTRLSRMVVQELAESNPLAAEIYHSYRTFQVDVAAWHRISEQYYLQLPDSGSSGSPDSAAQP